MNPPILRAVEKVTAFVTRGRGATAELLVFAHPTAGIQLPAGTVEVMERPDAAVLREVREETGLQNVQIEAHLGDLRHDLPPDLRWVLRATKIFATPTSDADGVGFTLFRGSLVRHVADHDSFAHVIHEEHDLNQDPPAILTHFEGYVRRSLLTRRGIRYFYHLATTGDTAAAWSIQADGQLFRCFWTPLQPKPALVPAQQAWLDAAYDALQRNLV
ncbi:MAG: NUDIX domain-containing protein [Anaerolineales bacterium]|nr:NUDIX domain-containing protein [Anaerolineales bacterium]MCB8951675.1 NUDIX domain-containing protein [Ardenticatenales bacterium]